MQEALIAPTHAGRLRWRRSDSALIYEIAATGGQGWSWWRVEKLVGGIWEARWDRPASLAERLRYLKERRQRLLVAEVVSQGRCRLWGQQRELPLRWDAEEGELPGSVQVWDDLGIYWVVGPAPMMTPRYQRHHRLQAPLARPCPSVSLEDRLRRALDWAGGLLHSWRPLTSQDGPGQGAQPAFAVRWSSLAVRGVQLESWVDERLNVVRAGFCLSGTDAVHDFTSLVSLYTRDPGRGE